jgi:putative intracellular protease/amidase
MSENSRAIGFVFIPGFADWEYGMLSASAVDWFGDRAIAMSPDGKPVASMSGFALSPQRAAVVEESADLDGVVLVGSDRWASDEAPDVSALLHSMRGRGAIVGGICAGTLGLARAGLFADVAHTSNGRDWILRHLPDYPGNDNYRDVPYAVADAGIVSAPGSAPGTFALEFLTLLHPDKTEELAGMRALFQKEYAASS